MQENNKNGKRVCIGPILLGVLEKQKEQLREATYGCLEDPTYSLAGEIIAKKFLGKA